MFYSCVILNDYKTEFFHTYLNVWFYSCVILNDYKTKLIAKVLAI